MGLDSDTILSALCPALNDAQRFTWLEIAAEQTSLDAYPDKKPMMLAYYAAHLYTLNQRQGATGAVTSLQEGALAVGFGQSGMGQSAAFINNTSYGATYLQLLNSVRGPAVYVGEVCDCG